MKHDDLYEFSLQQKTQLPAYRQNDGHVHIVYSLTVCLHGFGGVRMLFYGYGSFETCSYYMHF